jgi:hypothetical protein
VRTFGRVQKPVKVLCNLCGFLKNSASTATHAHLFIIFSLRVTLTYVNRVCIPVALIERDLRNPVRRWRVAFEASVTLTSEQCIVFKKCMVAGF